MFIFLMNAGGILLRECELDRKTPFELFLQNYQAENFPILEAMIAKIIGGRVQTLFISSSVRSVDNED